jgi:D-alanyl-lipoteichoic acid acyltransferase DltB (MBOAT superfamily)
MVFTSALFSAFILIILGTIFLCKVAIICCNLIYSVIKFNRNIAQEFNEKKLRSLFRSLARDANFSQENACFLSFNGLNLGKNFLLYIFSLIFYSILHPFYLILLLTASILDWSVGLALGNPSNSSSARKWILGISILYNLGVLLFFKYFLFLSENCLYLINSMGFSFSPILPEILLPLGISFFTFQSMSYTIDVYRNVLKPEQRFLHYGLYLSFFPQLVAGPIVKAKEFLPQIYKPIAWADIPLVASFGWILLGIFKKSILADRLAILSDSFFAQPDALSSAFAWLGVLSYSFQIYLDFSGYSDIAIGVALFFGFCLPINFNLPYLSASFSEFWRRWHISLSSWLRDYLYISLGGSRFGALLTYRNLFLVMLLGGLWHGASWNFLIWGGIHGVLLALERIFGWDKRVSNFSVIKRIPFQIFVFFIVSIVWVFFRSPDLGTAVTIVNKLFSFDLGVNPSYSMKIDFFVVCSTLILGHFCGKMGYHPSNWEGKSFRIITYSFGFSLAILLMTLLAVPGKPFIYFVF